MRFGNRTNIKNILEHGNVPSCKPGPVNEQNDASANERFPNSFHGAASQLSATRHERHIHRKQRRFAQAVCRTRTDDPFLTMERGSSLA